MACNPGFVTGVAGEARVIPSCFPVFCSGANPERARLLAGRLAEMGCDLLISFGLAGGLDPALLSGTLLAPTEVIAPDGTSYTADTSLTFPGAVTKPLAGVDRILASPTAKAALFARTGAVAADMESHEVARAALEANLPFLVLRAVADSAAMTLPGYIANAVTPEGQTRLAPILMGLLRQPATLPDLIRLGLASGKALATLKRALQSIPK